MTNRSPAAQAVLDAYGKHVSEWLKASKTDKPSSHYHASGMAAALRAAADQVLSSVSPPCEDFNEHDQGFLAAHIKYRDEFLAIADELEG